MNKTLETVGAVHTHTHTHTHKTVLNKRKNIELGSVSFEVSVCNAMAINVCFVALIDDS